MDTSKVRFKGYYIVTFSSFCLSVIALYHSHGEILDNIVFRNGQDMFMDFFNHISYVTREGRENVYAQNYNACFPPLAYVFYGFLGRLIPGDSTVMFSFSGTKPYAFLLYSFYCSVSAVLFVLAAFRLCRNRKTALGVALSVLVSNTFVFGVLERGNSAGITCILLIFAMSSKNSDNKLERELALILIAVSAGMKIYPCLFGLLYLCEKRWKEAARLVFYGLILFFAPFVLFGGCEGLRQFVVNQITLQGSSTSPGTVADVAKQVSGLLHVAHGAVSVFLYFVFVIVSILCLMFLKAEWQRTAVICGIMVLLPRWCGSYTYFYMVIPLIVFMNSAEEKKMNQVFSILFAGLFLSVLHGSSWHGVITGAGLFIIIRSFCMWAMILCLGCSAVKEVLYRKWY